MKKIRVSVGIPAFNEEKNIAVLLKEILSQVGSNFKLLEIIVISDGSVDKTNEIVSKFKNSKINLISEKKRLGKPSRLNQILQIFSGDVLILHDADIVLRDKYVYKKLLSQFIASDKTKLVVASAQSVNSETALAKAINNFFAAREYFRKEFDFRKTAYGTKAGAFVLAKDFAKKITLRADILNDDTFLYLLAKSKGLKVHFQVDAVVWYKVVQNTKDYRKQMIRFIRGSNQIRKLFNNTFLSKELYIPKSVLIKIIIYQILTNPLGYFYLKLNMFYCQVYVFIMGDKENIKWSLASSSKDLIREIKVNIGRN